MAGLTLQMPLRRGESSLRSPSAEDRGQVVRIEGEKDGEAKLGRTNVAPAVMFLEKTGEG